MELSLSGRTAVITGGETGIGAAITRALAEAGANVVIGGILDQVGTKFSDELVAAGLKVSFQKTDVRVEGEVNALVEGAVERFGAIDVMVNNAGVFDGFADCLETTEALWDQIIDINLKGTFFGCRAALKHMMAKGAGRIINTSSVGGLRGAADGASYTASKFGVVGLTRQIAVSHSQYGITVNAICPGVIQTDIRGNSAAILGADGPDMQKGVGSDPEGYKRLVPAKRKGLPHEVAAVALFLATDAGSYVSGQAIAIDGGWTAT
ncbi:MULTISPECIES: SDR family NAD(P)-dependent oxidoreductase [unclassified Rhizobium]|uniref:SDR family NAD(P)-dependent oxidoreductase n=1 Tax=unclassified Rhizobium TaxID=2613769 RepID=UPI001A98F7B3|nr:MULTISPECIES: SDR family NAD(P)-dependent oxidoreductase [unclassified Rhizobium]MBX5173351.1 SDR family oxidoreductase [Rhizobium sp. NZLR1b]MBX5192582.1 SDR family oxidoreductase [Rhizobium sp. NZLR3b]MBX5204106.1 SDR family oxidoreductase [Rhizobium sp. NZLR1]QSZ25102.1 SDR family oxidoreductase [Rhizobium sp. NZLR1]